MESPPALTEQLQIKFTQHLPQLHIYQEDKLAPLLAEPMEPLVDIAQQLDILQEFKMSDIQLDKLPATQPQQVDMQVEHPQPIFLVNPTLLAIQSTSEDKLLRVKAELNMFLLKRK